MRERGKEKQLGWHWLLGTHSKMGVGTEWKEEMNKQARQNAKGKWHPLLAASFATEETSQEADRRQPQLSITTNYCTNPI